MSSATEQKMSWGHKFRSTFKGKSKTEAKAKQQISEASTAVQDSLPTSEAAQETVNQATVTAQETVEQAAKTTQEMAASASATAQESATNAAAAVQDVASDTAAAAQQVAAEVAQKAEEVTADSEDKDMDLGVTFTGDHSPTKAGAAAASDAAAAVQPGAAASSWMDQMRDGFHQGFNSVSEKTMQGYEAAKTMINGPETQSWTQPFWLQRVLQSGCEHCVREDLPNLYGGEGVHGWKWQRCGVRCGVLHHRHPGSRRQLGRAFPEQLHHVPLNGAREDRTRLRGDHGAGRGQETHACRRVPPSDQPLAESQVEDALASAQAAGEAVATETSQAAKTAGSETEKALETSKGMMQEGADRAAAALKPKSVKVGGA
ncbi:unnamed protein product [Durusdinium trenchii]|uniref:Uncharacterized protein n=1 Tax=Durusdinium trenchii TaxID=1381693 RepID=A0ABP0MQ20_9DINO